MRLVFPKELQRFAKKPMNINFFWVLEVKAVKKSLILLGLELYLQFSFFASKTTQKK